jgi:hypothetical protein
MISLTRFKLVLKAVCQLSFIRYRVIWVKIKSGKWFAKVIIDAVIKNMLHQY